MSTPRNAPEPCEALQLDNQVCFALHSTSLLMTKVYKPLLQALGLTYPQYLAMMVLWEHGDATVGELGELLELDSGTLTPLLKRLEMAGFVTRDRDPADERRVIVAPTDLGWELREKAAGVPAALACQLGLPLDELVELRTALKDLAARMKSG